MNIKELTNHMIVLNVTGMRHKMKNYFFGKYYKFVAKDGYSIAIIDSFSDEGKEIQIITKDGGFSVIDLSSVKVYDEESISFSLHQNDINIEGKLEVLEKHPLRGSAMGPFKLFSMQCAHDVYSMYHFVKGKIIVNGVEHDFTNGVGYIEGDKGRSFPSKYIWYNSIGDDYGVTVAVATIPFGLIHFTGLLCFISYKGKLYKMCTYNFGKLKKHTEEDIIVKRGKYQLEIKLNTSGGFELKAPEEGKMSRMIKENVSVPTSFIFKRKNKIILERKDDYSSMEYMY